MLIFTIISVVVVGTIIALLVIWLDHLDNVFNDVDEEISIKKSNLTYPSHDNDVIEDVSIIALGITTADIIACEDDDEEYDDSSYGDELAEEFTDFGGGDSGGGGSSYSWNDSDDDDVSEDDDSDYEDDD